MYVVRIASYYKLLLLFYVCLHSVWPTWALFSLWIFVDNWEVAWYLMMCRCMIHLLYTRFYWMCADCRGLNFRCCGCCLGECEIAMIVDEMFGDDDFFSISIIRATLCRSPKSRYVYWFWTNDMDRNWKCLFNFTAKFIVFRFIRLRDQSQAKLFYRFEAAPQSSAFTSHLSFTLQLHTIVH